MHIKYLKLLRDNPADKLPSSEYYFPNVPMTIKEIEYLEQKYNNGDKFPQALRELLFLSGKRSYVNDILYAGDIEETPNPQEEMIDKYREDLLDFNSGIMPITRPFYIIDSGAGSGTFLFVYLDEGEDPSVYTSVTDYSEQTRDWEGIGNKKWYDSVSEMVKLRVVAYLKRNNVPVKRN